MLQFPIPYLQMKDLAMLDWNGSHAYFEKVIVKRCEAKFDVPYSEFAL